MTTKVTDINIELSEQSVNPPTPDAGQARLFIRNNKTVNVIFDNGTVTNLSGGGSGSGGSLADLDDVDIASPQDGNILSYDALTDTWYNTPKPPNQLEELNDVATTLIRIGEALVVTQDSISNGWSNRYILGSGYYDNFGSSPISIPTYDSMNENWKVVLQPDSNNGTLRHSIINGSNNTFITEIDGTTVWRAMPDDGNGPILPYTNFGNIQANILLSLPSGGSSVTFGIYFKIQDHDSDIDMSNAQLVNYVAEYYPPEYPEYAEQYKYAVNVNVPFYSQQNDVGLYLFIANYTSNSFSILSYTQNITWYSAREQL